MAAPSVVVETTTTASSASAVVVIPDGIAVVDAAIKAAPVAAVDAAPVPAAPVERKMIPCQKYQKQLQISNNYEINAWREAAKRLDHLKQGVTFAPLDKAGTDGHATILAEAKKIAAEWRALGHIPEEFKSKVTAPELEFEDEALARKEKRKLLRVARQKRKDEKAKLEEDKKACEARGETWVAPPKVKAPRKRKTPATSEPDATPAVPEPIAETVDNPNQPGDAATFPAPAKKQRKPRGPSKKKQKVTAGTEDEGVVAVVADIVMEPVTAAGKEAFLSTA